VTKKVEPLSTNSRQKRYICSINGFASRRQAICALLYLLSTLVAVPRLHAAEEPLPAEFVDYLGSVESLSVKGMELLDFDELHKFLQKLLRDDASAKKKNGTTKGKDSAHGDAPEK
jgi:hypothetical protein